MEWRGKENCRFDPGRTELYTGSRSLLEFSQKAPHLSSRPFRDYLHKGLEIVKREAKAAKAWANDSFTIFLLGR